MSYNFEKSLTLSNNIDYIWTWTNDHSCRPKKITDPQILAHSSKHSWTEKFLCLVNFYRRFILGFNHIAWPLNKFTEGNGRIVFKWTLTQQQAFEQLKNKLCTAPVLVLPDLHQPFDIEMDASDYSLSAVITKSRFILRISMTLLEGIWHMKNNSMPLCNLLSNGDTTFLARKWLSSLTINLCNLLRPSRNYRQLDNSSGLVAWNNFNW